MSTSLQFESTLTDRYQTTIPETIRRALGLSKRDKLHYTLQPDGAVLLTRTQQTEQNDPLLTDFLAFLARDIAEHPEHLHAVNSELLQRIQGLVNGVDLDLDAPLDADQE